MVIGVALAGRDARLKNARGLGNSGVTFPWVPPSQRLPPTEFEVGLQPGDWARPSGVYTDSAS